MQFQFTIKEIDQFARAFWDKVKTFRVFAFHGEMGAGKTTIITALCRARSVYDAMGSPTFSIINEYGFIEAGEKKKIYHIDLYRLNSEEEVIRAGVEDCISSGAICMLEWPEKAPALFDENTVHVFVQALSEKERMVTIKLPSP